MRNRLLLITIITIVGFISWNSKAITNTLISELDLQKETIIGKVVAITDGDTFKLLINDSITLRIRVANIDCPERKQPFSKRAKQFTSDAIFGKTVEVEILSTDRYGRYIGNVIYDNGLVLSEELLKHGYAWHYVKYSKDTTLQVLEDEANSNQIGLWMDKTSIPPWEWREKRKKKVSNN